MRLIQVLGRLRNSLMKYCPSIIYDLEVAILLESLEIYFEKPWQRDDLGRYFKGELIERCQAQKCPK
jgi:hypothetical protein